MMSRDTVALLLAAVGWGFYLAMGSDLALASAVALIAFRLREYFDGPPFCHRCGRGVRQP